MTDQDVIQCTAFAGNHIIASGGLAEVAVRAKQFLDDGEQAPILIFDDKTSNVIEVDYRCSLEDLKSRLAQDHRTSSTSRIDEATNPSSDVDSGSFSSEEHRSSSNEFGAFGSNATKSSGTSNDSRGRGRPKLGVVAREVTLLPRHWEWLSEQPGGASVALRKLVEQAKRANLYKDKERIARESTYKFMSVMAGNLPGFEEAARALFAHDSLLFEKCIEKWPADFIVQIKKLYPSR